jgi:hypothetical protein
MAISAYRTIERTDDGFGYLAIYGFLQCLILQQDAVRHLFQAMNVDYSPDPMLEEIREIRNNAAGHPTERRESKRLGLPKRYNFVARYSIKSSAIRLYTGFADGRPSAYQSVNLEEKCEQQNRIIQCALKRLLAHLENMKLADIDMQRANPLGENWPPFVDYELRCCFEAIHGSKTRDFGIRGMDSIVKSVVCTRETLETRGETGIFPYFESILDEIEYAACHVRDNYFRNHAAALSDKDAIVYVTFIELASPEPSGRAGFRG